MDYSKTLRKICSELPFYCLDFFVANEETMAVRTRAAYAGDLKVFFTYLLSLDAFKEYLSIDKIPLSALDELTYEDINLFIHHMGDYSSTDDVHRTNSASGKKRKIACLRSFFKHFKYVGKLHNNPTEFIKIPKIKDKEIVVITSAEQEKITHDIKEGTRLTGRQKAFHEKTKYRDLAILSLFLGTGIRVSELVGIDLYDIDFDNQSILITRKGGKREFIYFNNEVYNAICDYIDNERNKLLALSEEDLEKETPNGPLFISMKRSRISVRMVEVIIKGYSKYAVSSDKKVTPHVLRKTFGTSLYLQYKDIVLVQKALGHSSPAVTEKSYAKFDPEFLKTLKGFKADI